jgi:glycosyltransferase involved in cell wall biosynthesis
MKISFVVPVYKKTAAQVKKAIGSLVGQSHRDMEIIVVFDGPDHELELAVTDIPRTYEGYEGEVPLKVLVRPERGGAPAARNRGLDEAAGDIVSFWDADCYAEPEMASQWVEEFKKKPEVDFVYSGYAWTDPSIPGFPSEIFDPWVLANYNYIASMFPIKREKCPRWDETLEGLQDWDYWRRAVEAGCKGAYLPVYGFTTDFPDPKSISGKIGTNKERVAKVREKHKDPARDILVCGLVNKFMATGLAKVLEADYIYNPYYLVRDYKLVIAVGMHPTEIATNFSILLGVPDTCKRVIYWTGYDADVLSQAPYKHVKEIVSRMEGHKITHWADDKRTRVALKEIGIEAAQIPFPHFDGQILRTLPKDFKVLLEADDAFGELAEAVMKAMPDIVVERVQAERFYAVEEYSALVQLTGNAHLGEGAKNFLRQARYVISNIEAPYAGYVDLGNVARAKARIVRKVREIKSRQTAPNLDAQKYYLQLSNPAIVRSEAGRLIHGMNPPVFFDAP